MYSVEFTSTGETMFDALPPMAAVDVMQKLDTIEKTGVAQEHQLGVINNKYCLYLSCAGSYYIVSMWEFSKAPSSPPIYVTGVHRHVNLNSSTKTKLLHHAAAERGIPLQHITIL